MTAKSGLAVLNVVLLAVCSSCVSKPEVSPVAVPMMLTRGNLHLTTSVEADGQSVCKASYRNWTEPPLGHSILPPNTRVELLPEASPHVSGFVLKDVVAGRIIHFEYNEADMGMPVIDYLRQITSPTPVNVNDLSELDRKGIALGQALPGMTRQGVLAALGYPARHRTPSLEAATWVFWKTPWNTFTVQFGADGKVAVVQ